MNAKMIIYIYEYNNKCYIFDNCPNKTISNITTFKCELNCDNYNYYNYEKTDCLDSIPDGFYCNNTTEKTIDKCHRNCQACVFKGQLIKIKITIV